MANIFAALVEEYAMRRQMLIERSKVTLQSFLWSERLKEKGTAEQAHSLVEDTHFESQPGVSLEQVFAARLGEFLLIWCTQETGVFVCAIAL